MQLNFELMVKSIPYILLGLPYTLGLSLLTFILGNILGILITALGMIPNKIVKKIVRIYISFIRGVPALVILFILYFGLPYQLSALTATIICFTLTSSAFISEIYRGAISGVDAGQWDAAYTLDLDFSTTMIKVVLPQAIRISIPSLGNVAMDLLKGTSLAAMITIPDIFQRAKIVGGRSFDYMSMYILVALIYWSLCILIELIQKRIEKRANYN